MARKKNAQDGQEATLESVKPSISKADAVRRALAEGFKSPSEGVSFIKNRFGIDIAPQHFSAQKSQLKGKAKGTIRPNMSKSNIPPELLGDLEALKRLIERLGPADLKRWIDLLA